MFFTAINQMMTEGVDLTLVIRKANGQLAVSTLPKSNGLKDEAQNHIVPLTVNGKPEELDAGFLQTVARPIQKAVESQIPENNLLLSSPQRANLQMQMSNIKPDADDVMEVCVNFKVQETPESISRIIDDFVKNI